MKYFQVDFRSFCCNKESSCLIKCDNTVEQLTNGTVLVDGHIGFTVTGSIQRIFEVTSQFKQ